MGTTDIPINPSIPRSTVYLGNLETGWLNNVYVYNSTTYDDCSSMQRVCVQLLTLINMKKKQ